MSDNRWTAEQLSAITESGCNLLVAAAAGAGKTAVLVERIIRKITDDNNPVDIDKLLVVTFTNAAAAEMRERIGDAIAKALDLNPGSKKLQRQLTLLNKANITTIHSFCLDVIRNNFQYIGIDPDFRIADETESTLMKLEALEELFEDRYAGEDMNGEFIALVECYGGSRDDRLLQDMVVSLYEFVQSHPWPEKWLEEKSGAFNVPEGTDFGNTKWAEVLLKSVRIDLTGMIKLMRKAADIAKYSEGLQPYLSCFGNDICGLEALLEKCGSSWDELYSCFCSFEFERLPRCGKDADKARQEVVKDIREGVRKKVKNLKEDIFVSGSEEIIRDLNSLYPFINCLSGLVTEFGERYAAKKRKKSLLDFNDLEHFCLQVLTDGDGPSKTALEYRERFEEILVDEYQDSNLVQEVMLGMISRKDSERPNFFMVGDVKQSIYRFRQAKPELFLQKYNTYLNQAGAANRKILLFKNFRSRREVIDSVNFIFRQIMSENIGELDYNELEALNPGACYDEPEDGTAVVGGAAELHIIDLDGIEDYGDGDPDEQEDNPEENTEEGVLTEAGGIEEREEPDQIQCEAKLVVKRIRDLMSADENGKRFMVYDKTMKKYRNLEYKDIVILLRATRNWAGIFVEELGAGGIPAYADSGTGYFKTVEVQVMLSLLQIIDNPLQDIPLLSVLRSPIASFSPEELIDIRLAEREASIYEAMKKITLEGGCDTSLKAGKFLEKLELWRTKALYMPTDELIWYLYNDTGYYSYAGAMPGGVQRQANLRLLFERARQYEETSYKGLFNFINFINRLKESSGDLGSAKILGENENVVRIMSIHKSKGLEFPVVFVAGCGKSFNLMDMNRSILLHQDLGFGPEYVDYEKRISHPTLPKQALKRKIRIESLSEEMRILYVAMTRAREKLIMTGTVKNLKKVLGNWCGCPDAGELKLPEYEVLKGKNYLDWIGPSVMRHEDCGILRNSIESTLPVACLSDSSRWEVSIRSKRDVMSDEKNDGIEQSGFLKWLEELDPAASCSKYGSEVSKRLNWEYAYKLSSRLPVKLSVTELKRRLSGEYEDGYATAVSFMPALVKKPAFMEEVKGLDSAEKGTVLHFVMQHLDLKHASTVDDIKRQVDGMVSDELLTVQQAETVNVRKINRFLKSGLGTRILKAENLKREIPFNIELRCTDIYKDLSGPEYLDETILLQGVIDCCFEEDGEIVLLDYKTDYVPEGGAAGGSESVKERYRVQIDYYAGALEKLTGKRVKEKYIYLFWSEEVIGY